MIGAKISIEDEKLDRQTLDYRLDNLIFSQNMLNTYIKSKEDFYNKYIRNIFWSDSKSIDREYEKNMEFGRDFHFECQRIFLNIKTYNKDDANLKKISEIKSSYEKKYGDNVRFKPEYSIELREKIQVTLDLLVEIYEDGILKKLDIWDWKVEKKKIDEKNARNRLQTIVYMYVCKKSIGRDLDYSSISMHYYQPMMNNNVMIKYDEEMFFESEKYISDIIKSIREEKWE